ncbi:MAG: hypothetical protein KC635_11645 [Myxococcales bacterium]|nr:hypothetical protein [Myxococcales bacterium]MCB9732192.1 hypothetical protein [Deltaproteobacteria bacterium]
MTKLVLTACLTLLSTSAFADPPRVEHRRDRAEVGSDHRELRDDRLDLEKVSALESAYAKAIRHPRRNARQIEALERDFLAAMHDELRESSHEVRKGEREVRASEREVDASRREARRDVVTGRPSGDDRRDLRDDRRDLRDDRRDLAKEMQAKRTTQVIAREFRDLRGVSTPRAFDRKQRLMREAVELARAEVREDRKELREDRREIREDRRERREDRREDRRGR